MKIRIEGQSIRFRLSPEDISQLEERLSLESQIALTDTKIWSYRLILRNDLHEVVLIAPTAKLEVQLPQEALSSWLRGHEVEWIFEQAQPRLTIMIEKDLKPKRAFT